EQNLASAREVVRVRPADPLAWYNLGILLLNHGQPAEAVPALREALRLETGMTAAWYGLGCAHRNLDRHRDALSAFQQTVRLDREHAAGWYRLGNLHEHYEEYPEAIRAYRESVRAKTDYAIAWYSLAVLCREEGLLAEATSAFLEALHVRPHDVDAWLGLGITYAKQDDRKGLLDVYEELATLAAAAGETFAAQSVDGAWGGRQLPPPIAARTPQRTAGMGGGAHPLAETWYEIGALHRRKGQTVEAVSD